MGNRLIFLYLSALKLTLPDISSTYARVFKRLNLRRAVMARTRRMRDDSSR
jgi:hypothetical protein